MKTQEGRNNDQLRRALEQGIVDPPFSTADFDPRLYSWINDQRAKSEPANPEQAQLAVNPLSRRYQDHSWEKVSTWGLEVGWESLLVELARIDVPHGSIGFLKEITQCVADVQRYLQEKDWTAVPTISGAWGLLWFDIPDIDDIRWYLRLLPFDGRQDTRFLISGATNPNAQLPGRPYGESRLQELDALWYPPSQHRYLWALIPGGYSLRFYVWVPASETYHWTVRGKLVGLTQSLNSKEAELEARTGWNG